MGAYQHYVSAIQAGYDGRFVEVADQELYNAFHGGERLRSERLARALVANHPHDPRAFACWQTRWSS